MRHGPAEIHLHLDDVPVSNGEDLGIPKSMTIRVPSFIRDEHAVGVGDEIDEFEALDDLAVWPASAEVGLPVEPIVERAGEMKIVGRALRWRVDPSSRRRHRRRVQSRRCWLSRSWVSAWSCLKVPRPYVVHLPELRC